MQRKNDDRDEAAGEQEEHCERAFVGESPPRSPSESTFFRLVTPAQRGHTWVEHISRDEAHILHCTNGPDSIARASHPVFRSR